MTTIQTPVGQKSASRPNVLQRLWGGLSVVFRSRIATIGLAIVVFWILVAIFAPLIAPHDPLAQDSKAMNQGPSATYPLGTDKLGRDVMSRLAFGARTILILAPISVFLSVLVGTAMGLFGAYFGGAADETVMRLLDAIMAFPTILLYLIIISAIGPSPVNVVVAITFIGAPGVARLVRSLALDVRTRDYIQAAEDAGRELALHHVGGDPAQRARPADHRRDAAGRVRHLRHRHARLSGPGAAPADARLGRHDQRDAALHLDQPAGRPVARAWRSPAWWWASTCSPTACAKSRPRYQ